jgi:hypothetical protein
MQDAPYIRNKKVPNNIYSQDPTKPVPNGEVMYVNRPAAAPTGTQPEQHCTPAKNSPGGGDIPGTPSSQSEGTWCRPQDIDLYCEPQNGGHCGAHALAAMLMRQIAHAPHYLLPQLRQWTAAEGIVRDRITLDLHYTYYEASGWYSPEALNHWLRHNIEETITLLQFHYIGHGQMSTKQGILNKAPPGCKSLMIKYLHNDTVCHYKTWIESQGEWYECESMAYRARGAVRKLTDIDWLPKD